MSSLYLLQTSKLEEVYFKSVAVGLHHTGVDLSRSPVVMYRGIITSHILAISTVLPVRIDGIHSTSQDHISGFIRTVLSAYPNITNIML